MAILRFWICRSDMDPSLDIFFRSPIHYCQNCYPSCKTAFVYKKISLIILQKICILNHFFLKAVAEQLLAEEQQIGQQDQSVDKDYDHDHVQDQRNAHPPQDDDYSRQYNRKREKNYTM